MKNLMVIPRAILVLLLVFTASFAKANIWEPVTAPGGVKKTRCIECDVSGNLYTCSSEAGFFVSKDFGKTWTSINGSGLAVNPGNKWHASTIQADPNTGYLIASQIDCTVPKKNVSYYYRSVDGGRNWNKIEGFKGGHPRTAIDGAGFLPNGDILFGVCWGEGPYYSSDHGVSCSLAGEGIGHGQAEFCFGYNPVTGDCWMGSEVDGNSVFISTDNGRSWKHVPTKTGLRSQIADAMHIAFNDKGDVFYQMIQGVYRTNDRGATWQLVYDSGCSSKGLGALRKDPNGYLYAGNGVDWLKTPVFARSTDGGSTWSAFTDGIPPQYRASWLAYNPVDGRMYCTVIDIKADTGCIFRTAEPVFTPKGKR